MDFKDTTLAAKSKIVDPVEFEIQLRTVTAKVKYFLNNLRRIYMKNFAHKTIFGIKIGTFLFIIGH